MGRARLPRRARAPHRMPAAARREQRGGLGAQPRHGSMRLHRRVSGRRRGRDPPRRPRRGSGARRGPVDRFPRLGGLAQGVGALRPTGRPHPAAAHARGARCASALVRGAAAGAGPCRNLHGGTAAGRIPSGEGGGMNRAATSAVSAPGRLADFQRAFVRALLDPGASSPGRGFAVHRNTVLGGCIDALEANYPVVAALVGRDWFRDAAAGHVRASPPTDSRLRTYGADFHAFLASLPIAEELPFLPGVALLERFWREAHAAADAGTLRHGDLTGLAPEALARLRLRPHPAARWGWFDAPVASIWLAHQADDEAHCRPALEA